VTTTHDTQSALETVIRRDRVLVLLGLAAITTTAWIYLVRMAAMMNAMAMEADMHASMGMPQMHEWGLEELAGLFVMWAVMMIAMMLPSAAPVILLVARIYRRRGPAGRPATAGFAAGYILVWTAFSAAAAVAQLLLHRAALLSPTMASSSALLGGAILLAAGVYQWLPIKYACLSHCRSPLGFLTTEWREGVRGAVVMGMRHGLFCLGCCWALMALLFVAGVMNLLWIAAIAAFVLIEKLAPQGQRISQLAGVLLAAWGVFVLSRGL
jgi:predicted metal-binding membrane protein